MRTPVATCATCSADAIEPPRHFTPIIVAGTPVIVCVDCRQKARRRELVAGLRGFRRIHLGENARDPRVEIAAQVEHAYSFDGIRAAVEAESDLWRFLYILEARLVQGESTDDRTRDSQPYRELFVQKLIAMPGDGELHALVDRGRRIFHYQSRDVEREVREARTLDHEVQTQIVDEPDLWPEPVDGAALADEIAETIHRYVKLAPVVADGATLWSFFTHAIDAFDIAPILGIESPTHRCGKTTLLSIIGRLAHRRLMCSNISAAALYRAVEKWHPTLAVDEGDSFLKDNEELRGLINSGHTRELAFVIRSGSSDENHEPRVYSTWAAKVIALIGRLPATNDDRTIKLRLQRKMPGEHVEALRRHRLDALRPLHRQIARWTADHRELMHAVREPITLAGCDDRALDNWDPLLYIADLLGGSWPERARQAALALSGAEARADETAGVELLADLRRFFSPDNSQAKAFTDTILRWLTADSERPWATWNRGKPLEARQLARLLRPFGVQPGSVRIGSATAKGYTREDLDDAFNRYLPPLGSVTTSHPAYSAAISPETLGSHDPGRDGSQNGNFPSVYAGCGAVTDENPLPAGARGVRPVREPVA